MIALDPHLADSLPAASGDIFELLAGLSGEVYRSVATRRTLRVEIGGSGYFLKLHEGVGWREIVKNLARLRLPVIGAAQEWRAIHRLEDLQVPTPRLAAYGLRGWNPAQRRSFVLTRELVGAISLEDHCVSWASAPARRGESVRAKRDLVARVAEIARTLHENGLNHRDFYLCHLMLCPPAATHALSSSAPVLALIDLHRVQIRRRTPRRWRVKDLAALHYSSSTIGLTLRDRLRFLSRYFGMSPRGVLRTHARLLREVASRARALHQREYRLLAREPF